MLKFNPTLKKCPIRYEIPAIPKQINVISINLLLNDTPFIIEV